MGIPYDKRHLLFSIHGSEGLYSSSYEVHIFIQPSSGRFLSSSVGYLSFSELRNNRNYVVYTEDEPLCSIDSIEYFTRSKNDSYFINKLMQFIKHTKSKEGGEYDDI